MRAVAPAACSNRDFGRALGSVLGRPACAPLPAVAVKAMFGEMGERLLLEGAYVAPGALRAAGFEQTALRDELGVVFVVRALSIEYAVAAQFNDALEVTVAVSAMHGSGIELGQTVCRDGVTLVSAAVKIACVNTPTFKPVRIPKSILEKLAARCA